MASITKMRIKNETGPTDPILSEQLTVANGYLRRIDAILTTWSWIIGIGIVVWIIIILNQ